MRGLLTAAALAGGTLLCGFAAPDEEPKFWLWGTGPDIAAYNSLRGDCETLVHGFGRNEVWGRWAMPMAHIEVAADITGDDAPAAITFQCRDGSDCILKGKNPQTQTRLAEHRMTFDTGRRAKTFMAAIEKTRAACAPATPAG